MFALDDVDLEFHISARLTDLPKAAANIQIPPSFDLDHGPIALDVEERSAVLDSLTENDAAGLMAISKRIVEYLDLQEIGGDGAPWAVIQVRSVALASCLPVGAADVYVPVHRPCAQNCRCLSLSI